MRRIGPVRAMGMGSVLGDGYLALAQLFADLARGTVVKPQVVPFVWVKAAEELLAPLQALHGCRVRTVHSVLP